MSAADKRQESAALTYAGAGVDIEAGEKAVARIGELVRSTYRSGVLGDIGGFGGLFAVDWKRYRDPVLVSSTDGVGTKSWIARQVGRLDTIGVDLVAMSADDVAVQGAEPLFFLDYISTGRVDADEMEQLVGGVARGCRDAGCALIGGEMSEHPGIMQPEDFDLVGFCVGVVDRGEVLPPRRRPRRCDRRDRQPRSALQRLLAHAPRAAGARWSPARRSGMAWPPPHARRRVAVAECDLRAAMQTLRSAVPVHAFAHITGGGIPGNLDRVLPHDCDAVVRRGAWPEPRIFAEVQSAGAVSDDEMTHVFNLGLGMLVVVPAGSEHECVDALATSGLEAFAVGAVEAGAGRVHLVPAPE